MTEQPTTPDPIEPVTSDVPEVTYPVPEAVVEPTAVIEPVTADAPAPQVTPPPAPPVPPAAAPAAAAAAGAAATGAAAPPQWPAAGYPPPAYPPAGYPAAPAGYPPAVPVYQAPAPTSTNAVVALVLAVASWVVCPIVAAVVALIFAHQGDKEIAASGGRVQGQGLITAAKWVAWINIGLMVAGIVAMGFVFLMIAVAGGLSAN